MSAAATSTLSIDVLVDATPPERDRYVDFLRALSIGVVVCWHWMLSVTYWKNGSLTMPNPVGNVPLLWALFPTTACIAALAVFQVGVTMLIRPTVSRWLERRSTWRVVVLANSVAMTVFLWHMTALLIVIAGLAAVGLHPLSEPTTAWWLQRPLWLAGPAVVLAGFVFVFARFEAGNALRKRAA